MSDETGTEPLLSDAEIATLPVDERLIIALADAGLDESDVNIAMRVAMPLLAADLHDLASRIEWKHRRVTFYRDCGSQTRLHDSGNDVREYADRLSPLAELTSQPTNGAD